MNSSPALLIAADVSSVSRLPDLVSWMVREWSWQQGWLTIIALGDSVLHSPPFGQICDPSPVFARFRIGTRGTAGL